jgi:2-polyprenyl-6-hydroxyphenyl methylase/3-demethylubiquinone-9 3-methyltransferase
MCVVAPYYIVTEQRGITAIVIDAVWSLLTMNSLPTTDSLFEPCQVSETQTPCKCCGARSPLFGVIDFHENCERVRRKVLDLSGIPIYYYRCPQCRFLFTTAFDQFSPQDWKEHVYNEQYHLVDPDFNEVRPRDKAGFLAKLFPNAKPQRLLDYGGGNGQTAELLGNLGFPETHCYDPFVGDFDQRPLGRFDCVTAFEVVEHSTAPMQIFADMCSLLTDDGLLIFSTLLQPADLDKQGMHWWYIGPRNGHVSLYASDSLTAVSRKLQFNFGSFNSNLHVFCRNVPAFARHLFPAQLPT